MLKFGPSTTIAGKKAITPYRYGELILAMLFAIPWGLVLIFTPEDLFDTVRQLTLLIILPDWVVGLGLVACGLALIFSPSLRVRQFVHGIMFGLCNFIVFLGMVTGFTPVNFLISLPYFTIAILHAGNWWRLSQERRIRL